MKTISLFSSFLILLIFLFNPVTIEAQKVMCGYDLARNILDNKYPGYIDAINKTFDEAKIRGAAGERGMDTYTIDVVVHIVYQNEEQNLHDSIVISQIATLNEDFNRLNTDAADLRPIFEDRVGSAEIQFRLADIIRVQTTSTFEPTIDGLPDNVKVTSDGGSNALDPSKHLNIWVCQLEPIVIFGIPFGQVLGYAYPPADLPNWPDDVSAPSPELDGVVVDYRIFGRNNSLTIDPGTGVELKGNGRTVVHEIGHYLGLRHIWGDPGFFGDGCEVDDGVEDTPNQAAGSEWMCDHEQDSCTEDQEPDMIENYMDYSNETCMNSFTIGQIEIMRGVLEGPRNSLIAGTSSVSTSKLDSKIKLYPNPSRTNDVFVEISNISGSNLNLEVINAFGMKIFSFENLENFNKISLENLSAGIYYFRFFDNQNPKLSTIKMLIKI